jgi:hypothetical protein
LLGLAARRDESAAVSTPARAVSRQGRNWPVLVYRHPPQIRFKNSLQSYTCGHNNGGPMEFLIIVGIVVLAGFALVCPLTKKRGGGNSRSASTATRPADSEQTPRRFTSGTRESPALRVFNSNRDWLNARWSEANQQSEAPIGGLERLPEVVLRTSNRAPA